MQDEADKQTKDQLDEEDPDQGTTRIAMANTVNIANKQDTGKKNAGNEFEKTNLARTHKDDSTGQGST
jgi:hypothetical protein